MNEGADNTYREGPIVQYSSYETKLMDKIKLILKDVEEIHHWAMLEGNLPLMEKTGSLLNKWQSGGMLERHGPKTERGRGGGV